LKKNKEIGMPKAIIDVVNALAELRRSSPEKIESLVQANFSRLIINDRRLRKIGTLISLKWAGNL
jgi:hypothetical protein